MPLSLVRGRLAKTGRAVLGATKWLCAYHLFAEMIGGPRIVQGPSMLPTMHVSGDIVVEDTLSPRLSPPRINRGDLVTFSSPQEPTKTVCKRVIGLPGDTICVYPENAIQMTRSAPLGEELPRRSPQPHMYGDGMETPAGKSRESQHVLVPDGHIWISGDNTSNSRDSRTFGPIPMALVRGKIVARLYPSPRWFRDPVLYIE